MPSSDDRPCLPVAAASRRPWWLKFWQQVTCEQPTPAAKPAVHPAPVLSTFDVHVLLARERHRFSELERQFYEGEGTDASADQH